MAIKLTVSGSALPFLTRLKTVSRPEKTNKFAAVGVAVLIKKHLRALEMGRPNKMGFPRSHFWSNSAKSVKWSADSQKGQVEVAREGFRQRLYGGIIKPVNVSALTIPINPKAYNKRAREFDLKWVPAAPGDPPRVRGYLVKFREGLKRKGVKNKWRVSKFSESRLGEWYYVLLASVTQRPDPSVLPSDEQMTKAALAGIIEGMELQSL